MRDGTICLCLRVRYVLRITAVTRSAAFVIFVTLRFSRYAYETFAIEEYARVFRKYGVDYRNTRTRYGRYLRIGTPFHRDR